MAKRNPDTTGSEAPKAPERRRRTTAAEGTGKTAAPAKPRGRRKTDVTAEVATATDTIAPLAEAAAAAPAQLTAEAAIEPSAASVATTGETHGEGGNGQAPDVQVPHDYVALRAYHLYLERGGQPGDQFQDWVTAERQLREQFART